MINFTPHAITVRLDGGEDVTFPPSGKVVRVEALTEEQSPIGRIPVVSRSFGPVVGLDELPIVVPCLVSSLVLGQVSGRAATYAPDTGPSAIRDEEGRIVAVTRLVQA